MLQPAKVKVQSNTKIMNVTKNNFNEAAAEIERLLPSVDFVAIDEEMTGISLPGLEEKIADLPSARFAKMRKGFAVLKLGLGPKMIELIDPFPTPTPS